MSFFTELPARGVLAIGGDDCIPFLNGLVTNEVSASEPRYAALLTPQGKFLHDFFIYPFKDGLMLDCEGERRADLLARLQRYKLRSAATPYDISSTTAVVAIASDVQLEAPAAHIFKDPRHKGLGQRAIVARDWLPDLKARCLAANLSEGTPEDYDHLRLSLAIPDGSRDLEPERAFPMDYGLDTLNAISFTKGCYVGQELVARMKYRGLVKKKLCRIEIAGDLPPAGTPVLAERHDAGEIRSGRDGRALALLRLDYIDQPLTCGGNQVKVLT